MFVVFFAVALVWALPHFCPLHYPPPPPPSPPLKHIHTPALATVLPSAGSEVLVPDSMLRGVLLCV